MNYNETNFLYIIFDNFNFFDNKYVLYLLFQYKNRTSISQSTLLQQISSKKVKLSKYIVNSFVLIFPLMKCFYFVLVKMEMKSFLNI